MGSVEQAKLVLLAMRQRVVAEMIAAKVVDPARTRRRRQWSPDPSIPRRPHCEATSRDGRRGRYRSAKFTRIVLD